MHRNRKTMVLAGAAAIVAAAFAASGATAARHSAIPAKTFIGLFAAVPTSIDQNVYQGRPTVEEVTGFSSTLVRFKPKPDKQQTMVSPSSVRPFLATSWERQPDGGYVIKLRTDAKSSYGNDLTAADVKWSFERAIAMDGTVRFAAAQANYNQANPITVIDDHTVKLNVNGASPYTLGVLAIYSLSIIDSTEAKKHASDSDPWAKAWLGTHSASFGAYTVAGFQPGTVIFMRPNPNFFGGKVYFQKVVYRAIPDPSSRLQLMLTGQASYTSLLQWAQFEKAVSENGKSLDAFAGLDTAMDIINLNFKYAPFQDVRVRRALSMALDRAAIVKQVYKGYTKPALFQWSSSLPSEAKIDPVKYDPAAAKALLAAAGQSNLTFDLTYNTSASGDSAGDVMAVVQAQLAQIGVKANIQAVASASEFNANRAGGKYEAYMFTQRPAQADVPFYLALAMTTGGVLNSFGFSDPKLDKLNTLAITTAPGPRRNRIMQQLLQTATEDEATIPISEMVNQAIFQRGIKGYNTYPQPFVYPDELSKG